MTTKITTRALTALALVFALPGVAAAGPFTLIEHDAGAIADSSMLTVPGPFPIETANTNDNPGVLLDAILVEAVRENGAGPDFDRVFSGARSRWTDASSRIAVDARVSYFRGDNDIDIGATAYSTVSSQMRFVLNTTDVRVENRILYQTGPYAFSEYTLTLVNETTNQVIMSFQNEQVFIGDPLRFIEFSGSVGDIISFSMVAQSLLNHPFGTGEDSQGRSDALLTFTDIAPPPMENVPVPGALLLLTPGLAMIALIRRRRTH
ncbi:MAG: hypothetical protein KDE14_13770 [Rhodobacteraceae bacterium]|nr:hypothetical protein [Paracoccaceae bacterium]